MRVELPFGITLRTYYEDTDMAEVVYYANYLKFYERARTEYLRQLGLENRKTKELHGGVFVVAECHVKYLKPALMDDLLTVRIDSIQTGRASGNFFQSIWRSTLSADKATSPSLEQISSAKIRIGYIDSKTGRPQELPQALLALG